MRAILDRDGEDATVARGRLAERSWRALADPEDLREYDRFGPWLDPVTSATDMPPRFRPWYPQVSDARFLIKVPRRVDREQMRPGMDLYRAVLAVFDDRIRILELDAPTGEIRSRELALDQVVATNSYTNLLLGRWSLLVADGMTFDFEYNTVSQARIAEVDLFVRGRAPRRPAAMRPPVERLSDRYFASVLYELTDLTGERIRPIHVEEPGRRCRDERNRRRLSTGLLVLEAARELIVVNRGAPLRSRFRWANYGANVLTIPFDRMSSFDVAPPPPQSPSLLQELRIVSGWHVSRQACLESPERVAVVLAAHGIPRQAPAQHGGRLGSTLQTGGSASRSSTYNDLE